MIDAVCQVDIHPADNVVGSLSLRERAGVRVLGYS